jgi:small subunit ribosomal protein S6
MKKYESIFVINPAIGEERRNEVINKIKGLITPSEGKLLSLDDWGLKTLAYPVKGCKEGCHYFLILEANPSFIKDLERNYRTTEEIIKYMSVRVQERKPKKVKPKKKPRPHMQTRRGPERSRKWHE